MRPTALPSCALLNSTVLGGTGEDDSAGIAIDNLGYAYAAGYTTSIKFTGATGTAPKLGGGSAGLDGDAFIAKVRAAGTTQVYGLYLGSSSTDSADGIVVDGAGNAYVTGDTWGSD